MNDEPRPRFGHDALDQRGVLEIALDAPHAHAVFRPHAVASDAAIRERRVWGGALTAVRIDGGRREVFQVRCSMAQRPG